MMLPRRLVGWLRPRLPYLNIVLVMGAGLANNYLIQGFCQPVPWVWWVLASTVGAFLAWPWLRQAPRLGYLLLFLQGGLLPVCVYCTWFAGSYLLLALLLGFLLVPLLLWTPVLLGAQLLRRVWRCPLPGARWVFAAGVLPLLLAQVWAWGQYKEVEAAVAMLPLAERYQARLLRVVPRTYMAERLAGQLFKYHASPEMIFDGWRPPLHDPLVNVCLAVSSDVAPLMVGDINTQAAFYHKLFPEEPLKVDCACSHTGDAEGYYAWQPGLTDNLGTPLAEVERQQKEFDAEMARMAKEADSTRAASRSESKP